MTTKANYEQLQAREAIEGLTTPDLPSLSVVIIAPEGYETIRRTFHHLLAQTIWEQLEIVIVTPSSSQLLSADTELMEYSHVHIVEFDDFSTTGEARAAGVRASSAPIVAAAEDHSFPEPTWAELLVARFQEPWAAVGPAICNANENSMVAWADLLVNMGPWIDPAPEGPADTLPWHNTAYKRDLLLEYEAKLPEMLQTESVLQSDLLAKGHRMYMESAAKTHHLGASLLGRWLGLRMPSGRLYGAARAEGWPLSRRLLFAAGFPLIPLVRFWKTIKDAHKPGRPRSVLWQAMPLIILGLTLDAMGQVLGYIVGEGQSASKITDLELHRDEYLTRRDMKTQLDWTSLQTPGHEG